MDVVVVVHDEVVGGRHRHHDVVSLSGPAFRIDTDEFCSFSLISLAVERDSEPATADSRQVDDGQTNSVCVCNLTSR